MGEHQPPERGLIGLHRGPPYLLELWEDFRYLAEIIFRERMASTAASSTSALFLIRPTTSSRTSFQWSSLPFSWMMVTVILRWMP